MQGRGIPIVIVLVLVLAGTTATHAQPAIAPEQTEPAIEAEFESRLARSAEAVQLAYYHLGVMVAPRATRWVVSLVDQPTGRIAASFEIGPLPPDRDNAVAMMLQAVVDLEMRVTGRKRPREPVPSEPRDEPSPPLSVEAQAERARRQAAELVFRRQAMRFGPSYELGGQHAAGGGQGWQVFRGAVDEELEAPAFYQAVGRDDLADAYRRRHTLMFSGYVASSLAFVATGVLAVRKSDYSACTQHDPVAYQKCWDDHTVSLTPALIATGVGLAATAFASYFYRNPHPIDEHDAKALADAYNQRLRRQLGLPVAAHPPSVRDLALAPYVSGHDAGLALAGSLAW